MNDDGSVRQQRRGSPGFIESFNLTLDEPRFSPWKGQFSTLANL